MVEHWAEPTGHHINIIRHNQDLTLGDVTIVNFTMCQCQGGLQVNVGPDKWGEAQVVHHDHNEFLNEDVFFRGIDVFVDIIKNEECHQCHRQIKSNHDIFHIEQEEVF